MDRNRIPSIFSLVLFLLFNLFHLSSGSKVVKRFPLVHQNGNAFPGQMFYHLDKRDTDGQPIVKWQTLERMSRHFETQHPKTDSSKSTQKEDQIVLKPHRRLAKHGKHSSSGYRANSIQLRRDDTTSTALLQDVVKSQSDREYLIQLSIGTPSTTFQLSPDTGSSNTWITGETCQDENCKGTSRLRYHPPKLDSSSSSSNFTLKYGIGSVQGQLFTDIVDLAGFKINTTMGLANQLSGDWKNDPADGILGLGFRSISSQNVVPILDDLFQQNPQIQSKVISFAFGRHVDGNEKFSEMEIGGTNGNLIKKDLRYYPVTHQGYWEFEINGLQVSSSSNKTDDDDDDRVKTYNAIIDTGTSLIAMPTLQANQFWNKVLGSGKTQNGQYYTYPCTTKLNAILVTPDGKQWKIDDRDINLGKESQGSDRCVGGILASEATVKTVLGLAFLKNVYTVLDKSQDNVRIGLSEVNF